MVHANGNSDGNTRQLLFDFQYDQTNFEVVSINHTGTGGNGGVLPGVHNVQLSWQIMQVFMEAILLTLTVQQDIQLMGYVITTQGLT